MRAHPAPSTRAGVGGTKIADLLSKKQTVEDTIEALQAEFDEAITRSAKRTLEKEIKEYEALLREIVEELQPLLDDRHDVRKAGSEAGEQYKKARAADNEAEELREMAVDVDDPCEERLLLRGAAKADAAAKKALVMAELLAKPVLRAKGVSKRAAVLYLQAEALEEKAQKLEEAGKKKGDRTRNGRALLDQAAVLDAEAAKLRAAGDVASAPTRAKRGAAGASEAASSRVRSS